MTDFLEARILSGEIAERVRRLSQQTGDRSERIARRLGLVTDAQLAEFFASVLGRPIVKRDELVLAQSQVTEESLPFFTAIKALPLRISSEHVDIAMIDPLDEVTLEALSFTYDSSPTAYAALPSDIDAALESIREAMLQASALPLGALTQDDGTAFDLDLQRLRDQASDAPVIRFVDSLIAQAIEARASDIHIEAAENGLRPRFRIDGVLVDVNGPSSQLRSAVVSRIKILANLDIAERRLAQDGRIRQVIQGKQIDFRVSTTPSIHGENVVLRVLDRRATALDYHALGFDPDVLEAWLALLRRPHGVLLVTGPTGSGKTTTLYTSLQTLNLPDRKILTAEDPIEYVMAGISQTQVKPQIGLTFANLLRSFLRQDPDVMMIGEIRDLETAQIAIQAALTGHLVLSTVHTNDAASAMTRLIDMGVERYLLTSTVTGILAQRLVRKLCPNCRAPYSASPEVLASLGISGVEKAATLHHAVGCDACNYRGFSGRTMIVEMFAMSDSIRGMVLRGAETREIQAEAVRAGMQTMHMHGIAKALGGETTIEEVKRVIRDR